MTLSRLLSRQIPSGLHLALARAANPAVDGEPAVDEAVGGAAHRQHLVVAVAREEQDAVVLGRDLRRLLAALVAAVDDAAVVEAELAAAEALRLVGEKVDITDCAVHRVGRAGVVLQREKVAVLIPGGGGPRNASGGT